MSMIDKENIHICEFIPNEYKVLYSKINGWMIAKSDGGAYEPVALKIRHCPYCGDKLKRVSHI